MDNVGFVATGYVLTWISLVWYALRLATRSRQAAKELENGAAAGSGIAETTQ